MPIGVGAGIALGSLASGLLGGASSAAGAMLSYSQQKKLAAYNANLNYQYAEKEARNKATWNRAGLEQAGYNPMLAVQNATNGANASWTSSQSANAPDIAGGISSGIANAQSFQRLENETTVADKTTEKLDSESQNLNADTANKLEENKYIGDKRKAEISNIQGDTALKDAQIKNMEKQIELGQMGITVQQVSNANQADRNRILEKSMPSGKSQSFSNYAGGVRNIMSGFGDIIHGRNDYENYFEERQVTNGSKGRSSEKVTSRRYGKRKKR